MPIREYTAAEAYRSLKANPHNGWPRRDDPDNRFSHYADPAVSPRFRLEPGQSIFTIGSCFARNIERDLEKAGFDVPTLALTIDERQWSGDPGAALNNYVPPAIAPQIRWAFGFDEFDVHKHCAEIRPGRFVDLQLPLGCRPMPEAAIRDTRQRIDAVYRHLATCHVVLITLGLIEAWFDRKAGLYINCPPPKSVVRDDPDRFALHILEYNEVLSEMRTLFALLEKVCPRDHRIILTVSPVPLTSTFTQSDVAVANTYSKAVLRAIAETLAATAPNVDYFPSYESVTLTDRSIAFVEDQIHVEPKLVRLNVDRLMRRYVGSAELGTAADIVAQAHEEMSGGQPALALKTLQAGWRSFPSDPQLVVALAKGYGRVGQGKIMERLLLDFVEKHDDATARLLLATRFNETARYAEAARQAEQGLALRKNRLSLSLQRAIACYHLGHYVEGAAILDKLAYPMEQRGNLLFWRARFREKLGRLDEAETIYRQCAGMGASVSHMVGFAEFLATQGRRAEATEWIDKALAESPFDAGALNLRLRLGLASGRESPGLRARGAAWIGRLRRLAGFTSRTAARDPALSD